MSILTGKMKTARDAANHGSNCKFWLAGDATGNTIIDKVNGIVVSDDGTATHDIPHAISILKSVAAQSGLSAIQLPRYGVALAVQYCATSFALTSVVLGDSSIGPGILLSGAASTLHSSASNTTNGSMAGTLAATNKHCAAMSWDTTNLYTYEGINADAALIDTDALNTGLITDLNAGVNISNHLTINVGTRSGLYGFVLFGFDSPKTTAEVITAINWMKNRWIVGHYELYPDWI